MNIKKIAISVAAGAVVLSSAVPAFAYGGGDGYGRAPKNITVVKNWAGVNNLVVTDANTGSNTIKAVSFWGKAKVKDSSIDTGNADSSSKVVNVVNTNKLDNCGCKKGSVTVVKNAARVENNVVTTSNSGFNEIKAYGKGRVLDSSIDTGNAESDSVVANVVNTNISN